MAGQQVAPLHLTLTRRGPAWSLLPHHQDTFLNTARLQTGVAVPLSAGDIIGVGCPHWTSSRQGRNFTFVYKLNPPESPAETDVTQLQASMADSLQLSKSLQGRWREERRELTEVVFTISSFQTGQERLRQPERNLQQSPP